MTPLIENAFDTVSEQQWKNYCKHVETVEENMWEADNLQDDIDPFIIQLTGSSSEESSGSDDEVSSTGSAMSGVTSLE